MYFKEYYSKKSLVSYNVSYHGPLLEIFNQVRRIGIVDKFFSKYVKLNSKILDLGCGNSTDLISLNNAHKNLNLQFTGVDLGENLVKELNSMKIKNMKFLQGDIENFNLRTKFNIILELEVAEHLLGFESNLDSIKKHMNNESVLIISTPNKNYFAKDIASILRFIRDSILLRKIKEKKIEDLGEHVNVMSYPEIKRRLKNKGLKIVDNERTCLTFGNNRLENRFFGLLTFLDWILPKRMMYLGCLYVIACKLDGN